MTEKIYEREKVVKEIYYKCRDCGKEILINPDTGAFLQQPCDECQYRRELDEKKEAYDTLLDGVIIEVQYGSSIKVKQANGDTRVVMTELLLSPVKRRKE